MSDNVEFIKKNSNSSMDWSVVDTLRSLADDIESGKFDYNKCFIALLDDQGNDNYYTGFRAAQMKGSEIIALLSIVKSDFINYINGAPSNIDD